MKKTNFFAMLSRMKYINRWGLMRNTINENIAEHSLDVSVIAHALAVIGNIYYNKKLDVNKIVVLSLYHDTSEIITGDLPTPIKYYAPDIKNAYKDVEKVARQQLVNSLPDEMQDEYKKVIFENKEDAIEWQYVKAADKMSAYIKCIEEKQMGNKDFKKAEKATLDAVKDMKMPEVDYFLEHFIPAYSLTLDEQA